MVLGLQDILDAPATVRQRWHLEGAFEAVERHYDDVLVYGSREVFDVATVRVACPDQQQAPVLRLRLLVRSGDLAHPSAAPIPARRPDASLVVAMAGGGADGQQLFETLVRAVPQVLSSKNCVLLVVTGPFLPAAERARLRELAKGLPIVVRASVPDSLNYLNAADLVVAMAGYNTTAEILSLGRRALLVPRSGPSAEQRLRASSFAARMGALAPARRAHRRPSPTPWSRRSTLSPASSTPPPTCAAASEPSSTSWPAGRTSCRSPPTEAATSAG